MKHNGFGYVRAAPLLLCTCHCNSWVARRLLLQWVLTIALEITYDVLCTQ